MDFDVFVRERSTRLLRLAYAFTRDHALAEDLLQTAYARCWRGWDRIEGDPEPYVRRALVNTYNSWWRRRWNGERPSDALPEPAAAGQQDTVDARDEVWRALARLPKQQQAVLVLRYFEDLSEAQIADVLTISPGAVKSYASKGLAKLRIDLTLSALPLPEPEPVPAGSSRVAGVHARINHARRARIAGTAAATAAVLVVGLLIGVLVRNRQHPAPVEPSPTSSAAARTVLPSPVRLPPVSYTPQSGVGPFRDVDMVVPNWPTRFPQCVSGRIHVGPAGQYLPSDSAKSEVHVMSVVPVDFAGNGTNDYAVYLICGEGSGSGGKMVVGYRRTSRGFESLGRIVGTQDGFQMMEHMRRKGNGIEVLLSREFIAEGLQKDIPSQWRTYVLRGNGFQQVGSPVTFTPQPPAIRLTIQARPVVLRRVGTGRTGSVQVTVANSGTEAAVSLDVRLVLPESLQPAGLNWSGCAAAETGTYVCRIATLAAGATVELSYDVLAPDAPSPTRDRYVSAETDSLDSSFNIVASASTPLDFLYA